MARSRHATTKTVSDSGLPVHSPFAIKIDKSNRVRPEPLETDAAGEGSFLRPLWVFAVSL